MKDIKDFFVSLNVQTNVYYRKRDISKCPFFTQIKKKDAVCKTEIKPQGVNWTDAVSSFQGKPNTLNGVREALLI